MSWKTFMDRGILENCINSGEGHSDVLPCDACEMSATVSWFRSYQKLEKALNLNIDYEQVLL